MRLRVPGATAVLLSLLYTAGSGDSTSYTFVTVDITVPNRPGLLVIPKDINDQGAIVSSIVSSSWGAEGLIADPPKRSGERTTTSFNCAGLAFADASAFAINNRGDVAGYCVAEPNGSTIRGFVRDRDGHRLFLDVPGADHTLAFGISGTRQVVGQYYGPVEPNRSGLYRIHGFSWADGEFRTIDYPMADTYTALWSANGRGQILGEYYRFDPATNATLEHNWFVYESGRFRLDFPPSLEWQGGPGLTLADINDAGQIVGMRYNGGPEWNGLFLYDDGVFFDISVPADFAYADVRGMNNKGQFVGAYLKQVGLDPVYGPLYEIHGYLATPAKKE